MKMFVVFVMLLHVSQHALAVVVEVNEGERSVLLPCLYSGSTPEDNPTVTWTCSDLDPKSVHLRRAGGDDLRGQNQRYRERTSMNRYALITKDFSLTLRKPTKTDSGNYTCSISNGRQERRLRDIQLKVKDQQVDVKVREGSQSVILPCKTTPDLPEATRVEWTRSDLGLMTVHVYANRNDELMTQDEVYRDRTMTNEDLLRTGDLSLTLKHPTERDSGGYICTIYRDKDILTQKVVLQVKKPFPSWATAVLVLLVLLVVSGGLTYYFRHYFMKDYEVKVDSGEESVRLPCKAIVRFLKDTRVEWTNRDNRKVHVYENGRDQRGEQYQFYRGRTEMNRNLLKFGNFSLTLKLPTDDDSSTYTCTISRKGKFLKKKQVELHVRVPQEEVDSGVESILLPCETTINLPEVAKVEWKTRFNRKVHVYENGSDQLQDQDHRYSGRTKMNEDRLRTGDLSLTLKYPTDWDTDTYTCTTYSREGNILMKKQVELKVKVCQKELEELESVELPFKTSKNLPEDAEVVWRDSNDRKVHVYKNGSDQPDEQHQLYRDRTKMNEDPLRTGDLSLTLKYPTDGDKGGYSCRVYGEMQRYKRVLLRVKDCQVEEGEGAEPVQLPFKTTANLPGDTKVQWKVSGDKMVHVYENGSDQPHKQHQDYKDRTEMKEDLLKTGDLSLTLKHPTERDSGEYRCEVDGEVKRNKTVHLKVKGRVQVQDQTGDIRNRSSSIDPTPLMADQSV
uniref:Ig-like domain-containing protein n=1 Tax=Astatotilapia calliptera TaxID=8154 RepID=A0AAX7SXY2_ASTCA